LLSAFDTGIERTFEQDPSLALRLLNHIGLRALSPAVNDPYTAIQALDSIEALLRRLAIQQLDLGAVTGADGRARIRLTMPGWEDFVSAGLDELIHTGTATPTVRKRLTALVDNLLELCPPARRVALESRRGRLAER